MSNLDLDALEAELGGPLEVKASPKLLPEQARVVAGFEDILKFHAEHGRAPRHGENRDIFERLYATRLDALRRQTRFHHLLADMDKPGLLKMAGSDDKKVDTDALLEELGGNDADSITQLRYVKPRSEVRTADEIAERKRCKEFEFERFAPLFQQIDADIKGGIRQTRPFGKDTNIKEGQFFIIGGQVAFIASVGEELRAPNGEWDARLRVIYSNGVESDLLRRSLQRALYKDKAGRRVTDPEAGPLFEQNNSQGSESGTIYVLRSNADLPLIAENRQLIHKIGVTGGKVETRISDARNDPTYLLSDVKIVATYELFNINRLKLERMIQKFFEPAQLEIEIKDRFGKPVKPREWFLVPLKVIDEVVARIEDQTITDYRYDASTAAIVRVSQPG